MNKNRGIDRRNLRWRIKVNCDTRYRGNCNEATVFSEILTFYSRKVCETIETSKDSLGVQEDQTKLRVRRDGNGSPLDVVKCHVVAFSVRKYVLLDRRVLDSITIQKGKSIERTEGSVFVSNYESYGSLVA